MHNNQHLEIYSNASYMADSSILNQRFFDYVFPPGNKDSPINGTWIRTVHTKFYPGKTCEKQALNAVKEGQGYIFYEKSLDTVTETIIELLNRTETFGNHAYGDVLTSAGEACNWTCNISIPEEESRHMPIVDETGGQFTGCYIVSSDEAQCRLEMASFFAMIVVSITFVKVLILTFCAMNRSTEPLLTIGDAISSFLSVPDPTTNDMPFLQFGDAIYPCTWSPKPKFWLPWRQKRVHTVDSSRRKAFIVMLVIWWCLYKTLLTLFS